MTKDFYQNKYNAGDMVFAKVNPGLQLVIRRYIDKIYFCKIQQDSDAKELAYFERELIADPDLEAKNEKARQK